MLLRGNKTLFWTVQGYKVGRILKIIFIDSFSFCMFVEKKKIIYTVTSTFTLEVLTEREDKTRIKNWFLAGSLLGKRVPG